MPTLPPLAKFKVGGQCPPYVRRLPNCTSCGHFDHADKQAARNIKARAIDQFGLTIKKIRKVRRDSSKPLNEPIQLTLWGTPEESCVSEKKRKRHHGARKSFRQEPGNLSVQLELFSQDISGVIQIESPGF